MPPITKGLHLNNNNATGENTAAYIRGHGRANTGKTNASLPPSGNSGGFN
jgi:hypothetical protein